MSKLDPISKKYERVKSLEKALTYCFIIGGILSFAPIFVDKFPNYLIEYSKVGFITITLIIFIGSIWVKLNGLLQAEEARLKDFCSRGFGTGTSPNSTTGYYNDSENNIYRKIGSQILENCFYTKTISEAYLKKLSVYNIIYIVAWIILCLSRDTSLDLLTIIAQVIFSEEVISKNIRLFWLYKRVDDIYSEIYQIFASKIRGAIFQSNIIEKVIVYERLKAIAGISLPTNLFEKFNPILEVEWKAIQQKLGIQP